MHFLRTEETQGTDIGGYLSKEDGAVWLDDETVKTLLPKRKRKSHKGTYGKAAILAGSMEYSGAAMLSAIACARSGAGYTALFLPADLLPYAYFRQPEILLKSINEGGRYVFNAENMQKLLDYDSIAYGMGMGISEEVKKGATYLLNHYKGKLILDADGLNSLSLYTKEELTILFKNSKCDVVLTPHIKEFSRLSGYLVDEIERNATALAKQFAKDNAVCLLLKNATSIITDGKEVFINATGNSALAKGGSGDVLSGVIAGLCAMGASGKDAACAGSFLMGKAAELASEVLSEYSVLATDVIAYLGGAFLALS